MRNIFVWDDPSRWPGTVLIAGPNTHTPPQPRRFRAQVYLGFYDCMQMITLYSSDHGMLKITGLSSCMVQYIWTTSVCRCLSVSWATVCTCRMGLWDSITDANWLQPAGGWLQEPNQPRFSPRISSLQSRCALVVRRRSPTGWSQISVHLIVDQHLDPTFINFNID